MTSYGFFGPPFKPIPMEVIVPVNDMTEPPAVPEEENETKMSASRRLAFAAWNELKNPEDPEAELLVPETQMRLEAFAREVRNATIENLANAIKKYYARTNDTAVESLLSLKE